ncbi:EamA family transporter [Agromyces sp. Marseille-P2726]|uniref:EamA family transporter n=1 Tax=Agromyces sp. Marseille-P2726 TaxID=2709132 RepID=UPI00156F020E|nr:EamA family transporter [Agromyces sp. Marseille-P2726]
MILIVVLALGSALLYGVGDYFGGVAARRIPVLAASTINYAFATVVLVIALLVTGGAWSQAAVAGGLIAGVLAAVGFLAFYAALAAGPISLMSPLMALLSSAVPVVVAIVLGDHLGPIAWIAIVLAIVGSVLIGVERRVTTRGARPRTVLFAVVAGVCLGLATVALDNVPDDAGMVPVFLDTPLGFVLLAGLMALARAVPAVRRSVAVLDSHEPAHASSGLSPIPSPGAAYLSVDDTVQRGRARLLAATAGLFIGGANVLLMIALHAGSVAVVAVLVNLYPVATVLLAWVLLRERVNAVQGAGIVLAVAASVMLGLA